jgi:chromosome partitioning protein
MSRNMITIAIANQKGGVGKTTTAVNLSAALARERFRVLLVDLDAQAGATQNLLDSFGPQDKVVHDILVTGRSIAEIILPIAAGFDLAPSDLSLAALDSELALKANADGRLRVALDDVRDRYDFVFIDCPGWLGLATLNGFVAADFVVIPIDCKAQSLETVPRLKRDVLEVSRFHRRAIGLLALPTFYEQRLNLSRDILDAIREQFESATLAPVNKNTKLAEAYVRRKTIFEHDPTSAGAMDYLRVAKEIAHVANAQGSGARRGSRSTAE